MFCSWVSETTQGNLGLGAGRGGQGSSRAAGVEGGCHRNVSKGQCFVFRKKSRLCLEIKITSYFLLNESNGLLSKYFCNVLDLSCEGYYASQLSLRGYKK